jgi:hypothetical protein
MRMAGFYRSDLFRYELKLKLKKIPAAVRSPRGKTVAKLVSRHS